MLRAGQIHRRLYATQQQRLEYLQKDAPLVTVRPEDAAAAADAALTSWTAMWSKSKRPGSLSELSAASRQALGVERAGVPGALHFFRTRETITKKWVDVFARDAAEGGGQAIRVGLLPVEEAIVIDGRTSRERDQGAWRRS